MSQLYPQRDSLTTAELTAGHHHRGSTKKPMRVRIGTGSTGGDGSRARCPALQGGGVLR